MALTELNFSRRYFEDEIEEQPLMPIYKEYDARLRSFQIWEDYEEKREMAEMFAKAGYYFISKEKCNNLTGKLYYDALCFCCGSGLFVSKDPKALYPYFPFHNLDCQFVKCPPEIMNSLTLPPLKTRPYAKICVVCRIKLDNIMYYPCLHNQTCIGCAKKSSFCPEGDIYEGLARIF